MVAEVEDASEQHGGVQTFYGLWGITPFRHEVHDGGREQGGKDGASAEAIAKGDEGEA